MFGLGLGRLGASGSAFTPASVAGKRLWLRPSVTAGMWQDSAGTTSMSAVGTLLDTSNPVGLMLDYSQGAALGPELVTNGDFSNGETGWTARPSTSISAADNMLHVVSISAEAIYPAAKTLINTVAGKKYKLAYTLVSKTIGCALNVWDGDISTVIAAISSVSAGTGTLFFTAQSSTTSIHLPSQAANPPISSEWVWDNISVREIPGIHLTQSTSTARPVLSARRNLLTKTEDLSSVPWTGLSGGTIDSATKTVTSPDGAPNDAWRLTISGSEAKGFGIEFGGSYPAGAFRSGALWLKVPAGTDTVRFNLHGNDTSGSLLCSLSDAWSEFTIENEDVGGKLAYFIVNAFAGSVIDVWHPSMNLGSTASPYQRVNTASDYAAAPPTYLKLDGVDDSLASATFTAGTLGSNVDVFAVVRRDTAANLIFAIGQASPDCWLGVTQSGSAGICHTSVGTPTVWVDGVQLAGGTSVTRGTLHTALTVGDWHVVEFRNVDFSVWTRLSLSGYVSFMVNGAIGEIFIADAMPDATRAKVRTYLGKTVGKVL